MEPEKEALKKIEEKKKKYTGSNKESFDKYHIISSTYDSEIKQLLWKFQIELQNLNVDEPQKKSPDNISPLKNAFKEIDPDTLAFIQNEINKRRFSEATDSTQSAENLDFNNNNHHEPKNILNEPSEDTLSPHENEQKTNALCSKKSFFLLPISRFELCEHPEAREKWLSFSTLENLNVVAIKKFRYYCASREFSIFLSDRSMNSHLEKIEEWANHLKEMRHKARLLNFIDYLIGFLPLLENTPNNDLKRKKIVTCCIEYMNSYHQNKQNVWSIYNVHLFRLIRVIFEVTDLFPIFTREKKFIERIALFDQYHNFLISYVDSTSKNLPLFDLLKSISALKNAAFFKSDSSDCKLQEDELNIFLTLMEVGYFFLEDITFLFENTLIEKAISILTLKFAQIQNNILVEKTDLPTIAKIIKSLRVFINIENNHPIPKTNSFGTISLKENVTKNSYEDETKIENFLANIGRGSVFPVIQTKVNLIMNKNSFLKENHNREKIIREKERFSRNFLPLKKDLKKTIVLLREVEKKLADQPNLSKLIVLEGSEKPLSEIYINKNLLGDFVAQQQWIRDNKPRKTFFSSDSAKKEQENFSISALTQWIGKHAHFDFIESEKNAKRTSEQLKEIESLKEEGYKDSDPIIKNKFDQINSEKEKKNKIRKKIESAEENLHQLAIKIIKKNAIDTSKFIVFHALLLLYRYACQAIETIASEKLEEKKDKKRKISLFSELTFSLGSNVLYPDFFAKENYFAINLEKIYSTAKIAGIHSEEFENLCLSLCGIFSKKIDLWAQCSKYASFLLSGLDASDTSKEILQKLLIKFGFCDLSEKEIQRHDHKIRSSLNYPKDSKETFLLSIYWKKYLTKKTKKTDQAGFVNFSTTKVLNSLFHFFGFSQEKKYENKIMNLFYLLCNKLIVLHIFLLEKIVATKNVEKLNALELLFTENMRKTALFNISLEKQDNNIPTLEQNNPEVLEILRQKNDEHEAITKSLNLSTATDEEMSILRAQKLFSHLMGNAIEVVVTKKIFHSIPFHHTEQWRPKISDPRQRQTQSDSALNVKQTGLPRQASGSNTIFHAQRPHSPTPISILPKLTTQSGAPDNVSGNTLSRSTGNANVSREERLQQKFGISPEELTTLSRPRTNSTVINPEISSGNKSLFPWKK